MSSPVIRRPHATVDDALRVAEAMDIDTMPWEDIRPTTYETFRCWQEGLFASYQRREMPSLDANSTVLTAVPTAASAAGSDEAANECGICKETLVGDDSPTAIRLDACHHAVHKECMVAWEKAGGNTCPYCRTPLATTKREPDEFQLDMKGNEYWLEDFIAQLGLNRGDGEETGSWSSDGWWCE
ncbi:hypothetical protein PMIN03_001399 [Paraphaeosphaeria minitans]|uniref:RING-type domain-containing protein n=1 Tax=Paraphaeosphaeria minitans TaxID=565426 RepID=A0A9P6KK14_9PLEO|nr:hypothetical protein PMIN01_12669 [Paraphaeosphaeria minitans]